MLFRIASYYFVFGFSAVASLFARNIWTGWMHEIDRYKQKSGHTGGQAVRPVFVFCFRKGRCTRAAFAAQRAEQTRMPHPAKRKREYGMEESEPFAEGFAASVRFN